MLKGRIALITGAARGIGKAIAIELAQKNAHVIINDYYLEDEAKKLADNINQKGYSASYFIADVSSKEQVKDMIETSVYEYDKIDILVNNAGISPKHNGLRMPIYEMDPEEWDQVVQVNLNGAFYCTRYVAPVMIKNEWGRIVNITSQAGRTYSAVAGGHYCSAKAGMIGLTRVSAGELAPYNIIVNGIAPGRIETDMMKEFGDSGNQEYLKTIPIRKFGTVEDVAVLTRFLVSEENQFIVGDTIDINGGKLML